MNPYNKLEPDKTIAESFGDRKTDLVITAEMVRDGSKHGVVTKDRVESAALRFERTYDAITAVRENSSLRDVPAGYTITIIASQDAHMDEIERGGLNRSSIGF